MIGMSVAIVLYIAVGWFYFKMPEEFKWWEKFLLRVFWLPVVLFLVIVFLWYRSDWIESILQKLR